MSRHRNVFSLLLATLFATQGPTLRAQQQTADGARNTTGVLAALNSFDSFTPNDRFAISSPGDPDLGEQLILIPNQRYRPFSVGAGYNTFWTSNAFYTPNSPSSDVVMSAFAEALVLPHLGNNFFLEGSANFSGYRYFRNPSLDFNALSASAGVLKIFREFADLGIYTRYEYDFLFSPGGSELLSEHSLAAGFRKTFQFTRANALFVSGEAAFSLGGWPSFALTHEFNLFAAHQIAWSRYFSTSLFYQMTIFDFRDNSRADLRNFTGLSADIRPLKWITLSATAWLGWNSSNESQYDFFVANLGGGITASINF